MFVAPTEQMFATVAVTVKDVVIVDAAEATGAKPNARNPSKATSMTDLTVNECFIEKTPGN
jgi:hypothetical protein